MNVQTQLLPQLQTSLTLGHDWLKQMATAAAEYNLTIQYCMSNPRHALQSIELPAVTQVSVHKPVQTDGYSSHKIQSHHTGLFV